MVLGQFAACDPRSSVPDTDLCSELAELHVQLCDGWDFGLGSSHHSQEGSKQPNSICNIVYTLPLYTVFRE